MEAFWSSLKNELVHRRRFLIREEARIAIFGYIESFYNRTRLHSALVYQSPLDYGSNLSQLNDNTPNACPLYRGKHAHLLSLT